MPPNVVRLQETRNRPIIDGEPDLVEQRFTDAFADAING